MFRRPWSRISSFVDEACSILILRHWRNGGRTKIGCEKLERFEVSSTQPERSHGKNEAKRRLRWRNLRGSARSEKSLQAPIHLGEPQTTCHSFPFVDSLRPLLYSPLGRAPP